MEAVSSTSRKCAVYSRPILISGLLLRAVMLYVYSKLSLLDENAGLLTVQQYTANAEYALASSHDEAPNISAGICR